MKDSTRREQMVIGAPVCVQVHMPAWRRVLAAELGGLALLGAALLFNFMLLAPELKIESLVRNGGVHLTRSGQDTFRQRVCTARRTLIPRKRARLSTLRKLMIDAVQRYDGYIARSTGDGIFALFGAPAAREDHPQASATRGTLAPNRMLG